MTSATDISLEDVLNGIVGQHYPQGDTSLDEESARNMVKLEAMATWVAKELSCNCQLDGYLESPYYSMKAVAKLHDDAIMEMLEWFEPQVKRYYETWLASDGDD